MALDGIFLRFLINELKNDAVGCRVDKIYQPAKDEVVLLLRKKGFSAKMLMSSNTVSARIGFTNANFENPAVPPMLCMLLRKKLVGARLAAIRQPGLERVCFVDFETTDDFGDDCVLTVILEIMGRRSNFILCDDKGRIIDSIRRTDASDTVRILMPGAKYQLPPPSDKYDLLLSGPSGAASLIAESGDKKLSDALLDTMQGMCPGVCREISFEILNEKWDITSLQDTTENDIKNLDDRINTLYNNILSDKFTPCIAVAKNGKMLDFSYMPLHFYGDATISKYSTLSEVLDAFYTRRDMDSSLSAKKQELSRLISNTRSRILRRIDAQSRELSATKDCEQKRIFGELIKANLHLIEKGADVCRVPNYYDENCSEIEIPLKAELSGSANAARYFKEYRKACTAKQLLSGFIEEGKKELSYLETVSDELYRAETSQDIAEIKSELADSGYIKGSAKAPSRKKQTNAPTKPIVFTTTDGFTVLVGKNNRQNDILTLKTASKNDIWFHIKSSAGAHVILVTDGKTPPERSLEEAAIIAAVHSSEGNSGASVAVDYCEVKRVKKPPSSPPGAVIYDKYSTAFVTPDRALAEKLRKC